MLPAGAQSKQRSASTKQSIGRRGGGGEALLLSLAYQPLTLPQSPDPPILRLMTLVFSVANMSFKNFSSPPTSLSDYGDLGFPVYGLDKC